MSHERYKVTIRCNKCGERFILRGRKNKGKINTGFKSCLCNNSSELDIHIEQL